VLTGRKTHGDCDHVRAFTEPELRERFGGGPDFVLEKIPTVEKPHKVPPFLVPVELGAFFVAMTAPDASREASGSSRAPGAA
jgi:hypothetical protein